LSDGYIGEIRMFGGDFAPVNWALCDGTLLQVGQYDALYALIGNTYGGAPNVSFALPDLRGRTPMHIGQGPGFPNVALGESGGAETVALTPDELPQHTHQMQASKDAGTVDSPVAATVLAAPGPNGTALKTYAGVSDGTQAATSTASTTPAGKSAPHENMQPYIAINFIICVNGVFPTQP